MKYSQILNRRIQCTGMFTIKLKYGTKVVKHYDDNIHRYHLHQ